MKAPLIHHQEQQEDITTASQVYPTKMRNTMFTKMRNTMFISREIKLNVVFSKQPFTAYRTRFDEFHPLIMVVMC